jgi:CRISPR-associated endonuclease Csn1
MKKILGLDLGTTSIGWAFVHESEKESEENKIIRLGVRVNPLTTDEQSDFEKGKSISVNADRTLKRSARRNLQRYKLRRQELIKVLTQIGFVNNNTVLTEEGAGTTFETVKLRAKAANERIEKDEFARVLLTINKKRGYKSSRKAKSEEEGQAIDGMEIAMSLYNEDITPGQYCYRKILEGKKHLPEFYLSDLKAEFNKVWNFQQHFYPDILDDTFYKAISGQGKQGTTKRFLAIHNIFTAENKGTREEKKQRGYLWRVKALNEKLELSAVAFVLADINNNINGSSGYLGAISDRSKELIINKETIGQYLWKQLKNDRHAKLRGQVFYRQDYLDEFEKIFETQRKYHSELTSELKLHLRDMIIFYQRRLKSQKGLISFCEFESRKIVVDVDGKIKERTIGARVCPKSSPLFQEFKIWQNLSNIIIKNKKTNETYNLDPNTKQALFDELNIKGNLKKAQILKLLKLKSAKWDLNYSVVEGNKTNVLLYSCYNKILHHEGYEIDFSKLPANEIKAAVAEVFEALSVDTNILTFNAEFNGVEFEKQPSFKLWHLLYSYEGDSSKSGNEALYKKFETNFGLKKEYAQYIVNLDFQNDYGNLSSKAIRNIYPFIKDNNYSTACELAGYNHSSSLTKEENEKRDLKSKLDLLPKNSLRNPVVEKILNQMVNVVNAIIDDEELGMPDQIKIELARELKKSAKEREEMTRNINQAKNRHDVIRELLREEFNIKHPSRTDLTRYKLYEELKQNGYRTLYTDTYIPREKLFSKEIDIEHIIPKALLFDDSFSNKTLEYRQENIEKSDETAHDYILGKYGEEAFRNYALRVESLYDKGDIGKAKFKKLLMKSSDIGEGFIERDLRDSQYIAKKAKEMLSEICRTVISTTGSITDKLREDWDLINVMKELNLEKYRALGLTEIIENRVGQKIERIQDWTKRNDHRHHAMDALTVAFTRYNHIQYLNNLNARKSERHKKYRNIIAIENKETFKDSNDKRKFKPPMMNFRTEAKRHIESILISHKAKNKVVTRNNNKVSGSAKKQLTLTPRGQLHKETIYGRSLKYQTKMVKVGSVFDELMISKVANKAYKEVLVKRLSEKDNNPKKAFGGKNSPSKNPIFTSGNKQLPEKIKIVEFQNIFTIRKDIGPDLKIEKVVDSGIRKLLQERLEDFGGKPKEAFVNLDKNPIWLNKDQGIAIKRVTISGVNNAEPLHLKKDHIGNEVNDEEGKVISSDFVSTGNNHHVAIYKDEKGVLQEEVVSFYEAVARINAGVPIINKSHEKGWEFMFTLKQNEMFLFPNSDFNPAEIDLFDSQNKGLVSKHLYRVQKIATKDYFFRHHLETNVENHLKQKGVTWKREGLSGISEITKVRVNHLGVIVQVGEY